MWRLSILLGSIAAAGIVCAAAAQPFKIVEVASVATLPVAQIAPQTIAFTDHKDDNLADRTSGLMRFEDWAQTRMLQKQYLGLFPTFEEPTIRSAGARPRKKRLHVYVAEGRFTLERAAASIDLAKYVTLPFLEQVDGIARHGIVDTPGLANDAELVRQGLAQEEPRVDGNAVATNGHPGGVDMAERLRVCGVHHLPYVDTESIGELGELVCQCDVHVAIGRLGELRQLSSLG